ncbi:MAG: ACT domain-containing protein [Actinobacteria bacterium]|nr:ACT domain-containing protein [Actinomycetota bacterium]
MHSSLTTKFVEDSKRLRKELAAGASGLSVVRELSDSMDSVLLDLTEPSLGGGWALVAIGGYGRRELFPSSDIDLLFLHSRRTDITSAVKQLSYAIWDAGLELGASARTPKDATTHAMENFESQTAYLDARMLTGDHSLFGEWHASLVDRIRRKPHAFFRDLVEATLSRRIKAGDAGAELEPNIKDGTGGLRDLVSLRWWEFVGEMIPLGQGVEAELSSALETLTSIRAALHFVTDRKTDVLLMQHQGPVSSMLTGASSDRSGEEDLMRKLYKSSRRIAHSFDSVLSPQSRARGASFEELSNDLHGERWPEPLRRAFLEILREAPETRSDFLHLSVQGALVSAIPEWQTIDCLPQRNVYHRFAVDIHSFEVVAALGALKKADDDLTRRVAAETEPVYDRLLIAGLLHDIGKGSGGDHSEIGEKLARAACARIELSLDEAEDICWLVRNHLMLAETATRRDIGDEALIVEFAERVGSENRLRMLYLLTIADAVATGPAAWSPWKATLVSRLFTRVSHLLEQGDLVGVAATDLARQRTEELRSALSDFPEVLVESHLEKMPRAWLLSQPTEALARQSVLLMDPPLGDEVAVHPEAQGAAGIWEVVVIARDRPGLFSRISGALALHGLNVLGGQVFTREDGVALEVFRVEALGNEDHRFERMADDAQKAIRGRLSLDLRLAEKRKEYGGRMGKGKKEPPRVVVDNLASDFYSVIEVHATDRIGLLYTITKTLSDLELDVHVAKVSTYAEDVVDVFYVRDLDGQKIRDPQHAREIERTILHRLELEGPN